MSKAAIKRIREEMDSPYEGVMYENGKPRNGLWARFRIEDVPFIAAALSAAPAPPATGWQKTAIVAAMKQSFRDVVAGSAGKLFEDTAVTMPGDHVWERYADAALRALPTPPNGGAK